MYFSNVLNTDEVTKASLPWVIRSASVRTLRDRGLLHVEVLCCGSVVAEVISTCLWRRSLEAFCEHTLNTPIYVYRFIFMAYVCFLFLQYTHLGSLSVRSGFYWSQELCSAWALREWKTGRYSKYHWPTTMLCSRISFVSYNFGK